MSDLPHEGGLAEKVKYGRGGNLVSGWSWVMPVCEECGAVLADQRQHDEWHARIAVRLAELVARLGGVDE